MAPLCASIDPFPGGNNAEIRLQVWACFESVWRLA